MGFKPATLALTFILGLSLAAAQTASRVVGSITAISGHTLTVQPDSGAPASLTVSDSARILRTQPGAKKLSDATPIALSDLAVGDRVLAIVNAGAATTIVAMKHADIAQRQEAEAAGWQRGAAGLVKTVDAATGTVTIASGPRTLTIHTTPATIVRRYSPDSAEFAKAQPSTLKQIHPGDQLRVRGTRSPDGAEITADAIIAGTFRNIAGTVLSTNAAEKTVTVNDLLSKKAILIHITAESQLHKLPPEMAKQLAARLKSMAPGAHHEQAAQQTAATQNASSGGRHGGDLSQMLESTPTVTAADLHKGDAVIIVATQGTPDSATAVTLLAGVEPLLRAFPSGNQSMFSASWNLGGAPGGAAAAGGGAQ
jgi:hypothetical protein